MQNRRSFLKKSGLLLALIAPAFAALASPFRNKRLPAENRVITLYVDTGEITNQNLAETCNFGQPDDVANEDYVVEVNAGDTITWQGVSTSNPSTDMVHIVSIKYQRGRKIFDIDEIAGTRDGNNPQKVTRKALNRTQDGQHFKYIISFMVTSNGVRRNGLFHIDPVIQVH